MFIDRHAGLLTLKYTETQSLYPTASCEDAPRPTWNPVKPLRVFAGPRATELALRTGLVASDEQLGTLNFESTWTDDVRFGPCKYWTTRLVFVNNSGERQDLGVIDYDKATDQTALIVQRSDSPGARDSRHLVARDDWKGWVEAGEDFELDSEVVKSIGDDEGSVDVICNQRGSCRQSTNAFRALVNEAHGRHYFPDQVYEITSIDRIGGKQLFHLTLALPPSSSYRKKLPRHLWVPLYDATGTLNVSRRTC